MITVTVSHGDTVVSLELEGNYNPDILDDLCRRASSTLIATLIQLLAAVDDD